MKTIWLAQAGNRRPKVFATATAAVRWADGVHGVLFGDTSAENVAATVDQVQRAGGGGTTLSGREGWSVDIWSAEVIQ